MVAQGIQQALLALGGPVQPLGPVTVFNCLAILIWLALFGYAGLYDARRLVNAADEFKLILQAVAIGTVAATFTAFVLRIPAQRSWVIATWIGCTVAVLATRCVYRLILRSMRCSGTLVSRLLIVGAGLLAAVVILAAISIGRVLKPIQRARLRGRRVRR